MRFIYLFIFIFSLLGGKEISIGTYNVENLFDSITQGSEYKDYVNGVNDWDEAKANIKFNNVVEVLKYINADIIGLQEIENEEIMKNLAKKANYKHYSFTKEKKAPIGLGLLSKFKILSTKIYKIEGFKTRNILCAKIEIEGKSLYIFVNHWPSLKRPYKERLATARTLENILKDYKDKDFILLGDFNDKFEKNSLINKIFHDTFSINKFLDLWACVDKENRFSYGYKDKKSAIDRIFLSKSFFTENRFGYVDDSFEVIKPDFLINKFGSPNRWQRSGVGSGKHLGKGYSDHLPLMLRINTSAYKSNLKHSSVDELFSQEDGRVKLFLTKAVVIYKNNYGFVLSQNGRGIYVANPGFDLPLGGVYDFRICSLKTRKNQKEITSLYVIESYENMVSPQANMLPVSSLGIARAGDVIAKISGKIEKKGQKIILKTKKGDIQVYSFDHSLIPKDGQNVSYERVRIGMYKNELELILEERE